VRYALQFGRGLDARRGAAFVHMYVNELTLDMGETGRRALERLYRYAVSVGAIEKAPAIEVV
jgi:1,4-dihydroxy-6-naphthoate synthase